MRTGQLTQDSRPCWRKVDKNPPPIQIVASARHQPLPDGPINEFDRAVMPQEQSRRQLADRQRIFAAIGTDSQEELILPRLYPCGPSGAFAEKQKSPQLMPELGQCPVVIIGEIGIHR